MAETGTIRSSGIAAENGNYAMEINADALYEALQTPQPEPVLEEAIVIHAQQPGQQKLGLPPSLQYHASNLNKVGWGVIWPDEAGLSAAEKSHVDKLRDALAALIDHRGKQMQRPPDQFVYKPGQDFAQFLWEHELDLHSFEPNVLPYYLLIVGSPTQIPWGFQQYLDISYATGRLWFDDPADCADYVHHLLAYETGDKAQATAQEVLFVGTQHENDNPTQNSAQHLITPLHSWLQHHDELAYQVDLVLGKETGGGAYKQTLMQRLTSKDKKRPAVIFSAGHGLEYTKPHPHQLKDQGALICQDWPHVWTKPGPEHCLAGADIDATYDLVGTIAFCFACFSAGTPQKPDWKQVPLLWPLADIAEQPFVALLPQKLLARGLLAFIGHVSRAWDYSFLGLQHKAQTGLFEETLYPLLRGERVGHAMDWLNSQWPQWMSLLHNWRQTKQHSKDELVDLWLAVNDCSGYVVLGDPAARLRVNALP
jgi:hypothetical protein